MGKASVMIGNGASQAEAPRHTGMDQQTFPVPLDRGH